MGLKNNIAFAVLQQPKGKPYPKLRELFAFEDDAKAYVQYQKSIGCKDEIYVSPIPVQYGQVL